MIQTVTLLSGCTLIHSPMLETSGNETRTTTNQIQRNAEMKMTYAKIGIASLGAIVLALAVNKTVLAADATGTATSTVVAPITIAAGDDLAFGSLAPTASAGTVVLSTAGARTNTNVDLLTGSTVTAATFTVGGGASAAYSITLPTTATLTSGGNNMTVNNFVHSAGGSPTVDGSGSGPIQVGATLNVGANQAAGAYTGTYQVTVNCN